MEILKKNKKKIIIFGIIVLIAVYIMSCNMRGYYAPTWEKQDIGAVLQKVNKTKEDYAFLFSQTGLGQSAIEDLLKEGNIEEIKDFSRQYFDKVEYETEMMFFPIVMTEQKKGAPIKVAPLERGDVLVSLTTHTLGFRHGHAGMVLNGETGEILEHFVLGETSRTGRVYGFRSYPTFAVLRYKDKTVAAAAANYAEENLVGIPYNPLAGLIKKDKSSEKPISSSQCSHLVWQAYKAVGADVDGNGGVLVLPKDFLKCRDFEIVQIYGIKPPKK